MRSALLFVCFLPWLAAQRPVVVIGIDGLASSAVRNGATPEMDALIRNGTWTLRARGVMPTVSSPNWASIISGAGPEEHGVTSNEWERDRRDFTPVCTGRESIFPTLFGQLREAKPAARIYVFHDWDGFGRLVERGVADRLEHHKGSPATVDAALAAVKPVGPICCFSTWTTWTTPATSMGGGLHNTWTRFGALMNWWAVCEKRCPLALPSSSPPIMAAPGRSTAGTRWANSKSRGFSPGQARGEPRSHRGCEHSRYRADLSPAARHHTPRLLARPVLWIRPLPPHQDGGARP